MTELYNQGQIVLNVVQSRAYCLYEIKVLIELLECVKQWINFNI